MKCDVAVIGAGAAGIAAAISAANAGLNVVLVERDGLTGGLATSAMVGTICGLYYRNLDETLAEPRFAVQGFTRKFAEQISLKSNSLPLMFAEGLYFLPYKLNVFHELALEQLVQAGVQLLLNTSLSSVQLSEEQVVELGLHTNNQSISVAPKTVIDCSGNAQVSTLAGLDVIKQQHYQSGALVFQVSGLPQLESGMLGLNLIRWIKRGINKGDLDKGCDRLSIIPGTVNSGVGLFKLGLPGFVNDDTVKLAEYELMARSRSEEIIAFLSRSEPLLKHLSIIKMATQVGVRSGFRSQGLHILEQQQVLACEKPDDGVAIGAWPIEYWGRRRMPEMDYFNVNDFYLIPAPALVSQHLGNLFFAGRSISATERAIASARVIGTCLSTGYAAGMLAAEFVKQGVWQSAIAQIRQTQVFAQEG
jgi:hypothetical protein